MKSVTILFILLITIPAYAIAQDNGEITVPLSDPSARAKVVVDIRKGSIEVIGTARKDILVRYEAMDKIGDTPDESSNGLKKIASAALDLEVTEKNNSVEIESDSWQKGLNLYVEVPRGVDLHVETYNSGDISISNIQGEVVADNYNGGIKASKISGSLVADSYNGAIIATFDAVTSGTPMAFTTYNGDVDLTFPATFKGHLKMKTARGDIYSGFEFTLQKAEPKTKTDKNSSTFKVYLDDWVQGDVNGGGPEIMIKNYNGDIYIRKS